MAKGVSGGKRGGGGGTRYTSSDKTTYESNDEVLYVERLTKQPYDSGDRVLDARSDGKGNITLSNASADEYYQKNSKTTYAMYELRSGITNVSDVRRGEFSDGRGTGDKQSKVKSGNEEGKTRSVGINWDNVKSVSGDTYNVKELLKKKGFKWNGASKNWTK